MASGRLIWILVSKRSASCCKGSRLSCLMTSGMLRRCTDALESDGRPSASCHPCCNSECTNTQRRSDTEDFRVKGLRFEANDHIRREGNHDIKLKQQSVWASFFQAYTCSWQKYSQHGWNCDEYCTVLLEQEARGDRGGQITTASANARSDHSVFAIFSAAAPS